MSNVSIETGGNYYISAYIYEDSYFSNRISSDSCQSACVFDFDYDRYVAVKFLVHSNDCCQKKYAFFECVLQQVLT